MSKVQRLRPTSNGTSKDPAVVVDGSKEGDAIVQSPSTEAQNRLRNLVQQLNIAKSRLSEITFQVMRAQQDQQAAFCDADVLERRLIEEVNEAAVVCGLNVPAEQWNLNLDTMTWTRVR